MQIILLEKIANVGNLGDVVKVKNGFARNFLIPQGQGQARDAGEPEAARGEARGARERPRTTSSRPRRRSREKLEGTTVQITQKAGVDGRLFGSVDQRRHRRGAEGARHRGREGAGPHAGGPAQARRRPPGDGRAAHRRRRAHHGDRAWRDTDRAGLTPAKARRDAATKAPAAAPSSFRPRSQRPSHARSRDRAQ